MADLIKRDSALKGYDTVLSILDSAVNAVSEAKAIVLQYGAEPELSETCTDCKEYDQERHCCPRWNKVIKRTVEDLESAHAWHECFEDDPSSFPDDDRNVLVSFSNFSLSIIGQWRVDEDGYGCWYLGDTDETFLSKGLFVDGWWELPKKPERN